MSYVILTERKPKPAKCPIDWDGANFWSHTHGAFSTLEQANRFSTFEIAQPTVHRLRYTPGSKDFFYAVPLPEGR